MATSLPPCGAGALVFLLARISARIYAVHLKRKALLVVVAFAALFASTSVFASIPRSDVFTPAVERFAFENAPPARPESTAVLHLDRQLRSAAVAAWPLDRLPETRVSDFDFARPLLPQAEPQLTRALRQGYERLERRRASGDEYRDSSNLYAFAAGDPVNQRDPSGEAASMSLSGWIVATDNRNGGRIVRFSPEEIARNPQKVRAFLGLNADVNAREADAMIERAGAAWATGSDKMRVVAPGAAKAAGVYPLMAITAGAGIGGGVGAVASAEVGLGFVGTHLVGGFTGGVGAQAGNDAATRQLSSGQQYLSAGAEGAVVSLAIGGVVRVIRGPAVTPELFPEGIRPSTVAPAPVVEQPPSVRGTNRTRLGVRRTNQADWRSLRNLWDEMGYGDILSPQNRTWIAQGRPPEVDAQWVRHFPGDAPLMGEQITIHHIGGGKISVPLPKSRHIDAHKPGGFRRHPGGPGTSG